MSSRRRRKQSRTRRLEGAEAQQRQAAAANAAFWHGSASAAEAAPDSPSASSPESSSGSAPSGDAGADGPAQPKPVPAQLRDASAARPRVTAEDVLTADRRVTVTTDPTSTVRSLGKPPLAGRETAAEVYFEAVYQRAVAMAGALAAAGGLLHEPDNDLS